MRIRRRPLHLAAPPALPLLSKHPRGAGDGDLTGAALSNFLRSSEIPHRRHIPNRQRRPSTRVCRLVSVACFQGFASSNEPEDDNINPRFYSRDGGANCRDFEAQHRQWAAVIARIREHVCEFFINAKRAFQNLLEINGVGTIEAREAGKTNGASSTEPNQEWAWDWKQWTEHFSKIEEEENLASVLKFQLDDAIEGENFQEAACLRNRINVANANDHVSEVLAKLKKALAEERYGEAAFLRDNAGAGLVGLWVGLAEGENDPFGRIVNISPTHGRYIARGYSTRQLMLASPGVPLFEVFIVKDFDGCYHQQAVYLQHDGGMSNAGTAKALDANINVNIVDMTSVNEGGKEAKAHKENGDEKGRNEDIDESLSRIINFLKERMPDVKLKVFRVVAQDSADLPRIVERILENIDAQQKDGETGPIDDAKKEAKREISATSSSGLENRKEMPIRMILGGTEEKLLRSPIRIPAKIECRGRDAFVLHIEDSADQQLPSPEISMLSKVTAVSSEALKDLPTLDAKVTKDMGEFLKIALNHVRRRHGLSSCTTFTRINVMDGNADPLTGLFVGAFGPYMSELIQLRRKYGCWDGELEKNKGKMDFFEYVEAVKITGDMNVPAGQITFRAKVGKKNRLSHAGVYVDELGVAARYKGQGRLAEAGFKNPHWVDGELLVFAGRGIGHLHGAELGFIYSVPDQHYPVLFNRLKLQV